MYTHKYMCTHTVAMYTSTTTVQVYIYDCTCTCCNVHTSTCVHTLQCTLVLYMYYTNPQTVQSYSLESLLYSIVHYSIVVYTSAVL